jgi:hypothetical protein
MAGRSHDRKIVSAIVMFAVMPKRFALILALLVTVVPRLLFGQSARIPSGVVAPHHATQVGRASIASYKVMPVAAAATHRHVVLGLGVGFLGGTLAGLGLEAAGKHGEQRTLDELKGAIGGALLGTIIGGTIGYFWRS